MNAKGVKNMKRLMIILPLAGLMALLYCAEWGFEYDNPWDNDGTGNPVDSATNSDTSKGNNINNYRVVQIGTQKWMAENLDYDVAGSNSNDSCAKCGRLYNWSTAMAACPAGWHLPSDAEWDILVNYVGSNAGTKLKSPNYWEENYIGVPKGTDEYGWSALPGGYGYSDGGFFDAGGNGYWWSSTEDVAYDAWSRGMNYGSENVFRILFDKTYLFSVRCVQD
jgi:uncharacterized protein (TIGR02145 family)